MVRRIWLMGAALVFSLLLPGSSAEACSCAMPDHAAAVDMHEVAFEGTVVGVTARAGGLASFRFRVGTAFKGVTTRFVEVVGPAPDNAHGFLCPRPAFRAQRTYRVYVNRNDAGELEVGGCNPSRRARG